MKNVIKISRVRTSSCSLANHCVVETPNIQDKVYSAVDDGIVMDVISNIPQCWRRRIIINHSSNKIPIYSEYRHFKKAYVQRGQKVSKGDLLARW